MDTKNKQLQFSSLKDITMWLNKARGYITKYADVTPCKKWNKWLNHKEVPFPCVCPIRNKECFALEIYFEIFRAYKILKLENECKNAIQEYHNHINNKQAIRDWIESYSNLYNKLLHFKSKITISTIDYFYSIRNIEFNMKETIQLLEF